MGGLDEGVFLGDNLHECAHGQGLTGLVHRGLTEADIDHLLEVVGGLIGRIGQLQATRLVLCEPLAFVVADFVEHLSVELFIVNGREVVDDGTGSNLDAQETARARGVMQGMQVVRRGHERGVALTVGLRATIDGTPVHTYLRQQLLKLCLLRTAHLIELVDVHQQVVRQRHLLVELIAQVHMVEEVLAQLFGQQQAAEGALAATLCANQRGHHLIAVQRIHLQPVSHHRAHPDGEPVALVAADAGQAVEEGTHVVLAVPGGQRLKLRRADGSLRR